MISRMSGGAPLILGILGWHGRDIGAGAAGCLWYPAGTNRGRKQGAKAHFSLSRFGDYPISLTLTSLTGPGEFNTIPFRRIEKTKPLLLLIELSLFCKDSSILSRLQWWSYCLTNGFQIFFSFEGSPYIYHTVLLQAPCYQNDALCY